MHLLILFCIGDENDDEPMFQKIHARYEERGLVPRHGPASAAGVMGMKVDERHRQGHANTKTWKIFQDY